MSTSLTNGQNSVSSSATTTNKWFNFNELNFIKNEWVETVIYEKVSVQTIMSATDRYLIEITIGTVTMARLETADPVQAQDWLNAQIDYVLDFYLREYAYKKDLFNTLAQKDEDEFYDLSSPNGRSEIYFETYFDNHEECVYDRCNKWFLNRREGSNIWFITNAEGEEVAQFYYKETIDNLNDALNVCKLVYGSLGLIW